MRGNNGATIDTQEYPVKLGMINMINGLTILMVIFGTIGNQTGRERNLNNYRTSKFFNTGHIDGHPPGITKWKRYR